MFVTVCPDLTSISHDRHGPAMPCSLHGRWSHRLAPSCVLRKIAQVQNSGKHSQDVSAFFVISHFFIEVSHEMAWSLLSRIAVSKWCVIIWSLVTSTSHTNVPVRADIIFQWAISWMGHFICVPPAQTCSYLCDLKCHLEHRVQRRQPSRKKWDWTWVCHGHVREDKKLHIHFYSSLSISTRFKQVLPIWHKVWENHRRWYDFIRRAKTLRELVTSLPGPFSPVAYSD